MAGGNVLGYATRGAHPRRVRPVLGILPGSLDQLEHRCCQEQDHHSEPGVTTFTWVDLPLLFCSRQTRGFVCPSGQSDAGSFLKGRRKALRLCPTAAVRGGCVSGRAGAECAAAPLPRLPPGKSPGKDV